MKQSVIAENGIVATSQPQAAQAGLEILKKGGNAVDAALATAIALSVVEPTSNGIGADAFAIVWDGKQLHGLNASGKCPQRLGAETVIQADHDAIPQEGWLSVTIPGAPAAWNDLHARFGSLPIEDIFQPAMEFAQNGFKVTPVVAYHWEKSGRRFSRVRDPECGHWKNTFTVDGASPRSGDLFRLLDHAGTLREMCQHGIDSFYTGSLAEKIVDFSNSTGGYITAQDLADHRNLWVDPVSINYRGVDVYEMPPNGQGLAALEALAIFECHDPGLALSGADSLHAQIEAMKLACVDAYRYIADIDYSPGIHRALLDPAYIRARAGCLTDQALDPCYGELPTGGTVYLCTADKNGMMVSYIQSNYEGFGSGVVIPETGIAMQNRGACFSLDPAHPNVMAPGKRPFHTIIPGFLMQKNKPLGPFGVMGGFMQPQGHLQVLTAMIDQQLDPQSALNRPRWRIIEGRQLEVEPGFDPSLVTDLARRGHKISQPEDVSSFGRGQIILNLNDKYTAGSDLRADGLAAGY